MITRPKIIKIKNLSKNNNLKKKFHLQRIKIFAKFYIYIYIYHYN